MEDAGALIGVLFIFFIYFLVIVFAIYVQWVIFAKAGKPGWAAIVPIYNLIVMNEITGRESWWVVLYILFPITLLVVPFDLAKSFGKGSGFAIGLLLLSLIFYAIMAFDKNITYQGPAVAKTA